MASNFGVFASLVTTVGSIAAASVAVVYIVKGHNRWEPSEQDLPKYYERLAAIVVAAFLVSLWYYFSVANRDAKHELWIVSLVLLAICVISGLMYFYLFGVSRFTIEKAISKSKTTSETIVGGFKLRDSMNSWVHQHGTGQTTQELLAGNGYDPDRLWERSSRMLAKVSLLSLYVLFVGSAAGVLIAFAILVEQSNTGKAPNPIPTSVLETPRPSS